MRALLCTVLVMALAWAVPSRAQTLTLTPEQMQQLQRQLEQLPVLVQGATAPKPVEPPQPLKISENGRYFVKTDGTPFFWLGDTAWSIFNHATPEEVDAYLDDRAAKGFNVIQGCIVLWDGMTRPNPDGHLPFRDGDPTRINAEFFLNVDSILEKVERRGMHMAILPVWIKGYIQNREQYANTMLNPESLKSYCRFLGTWYGKRPIIWVLGGDWPGRDTAELSNAMAAGLIEGAGTSDILITYHPTGRQSSSFWFHEASWLDFNMIQSGHFIQTSNFNLIADDWAKSPVKPTLDAEPAYENITDRLIRNDPNARRISAHDVRRSAYLAVFAGAAGHTYGNGEVYEFWSPEKEVNMPGWAANLPFADSLKLPGSGQMQHLRRLMESRPMLSRIPDQSMILEPSPPAPPPTTAPTTSLATTGPAPSTQTASAAPATRPVTPPRLAARATSERATDRMAATRSFDGSYAFIYVQNGEPFRVDLSKMTGRGIRAWWFDPRYGSSLPIADFAKTAYREFKAPSDPVNPDWVLVLDSLDKRYPAPGGLTGAPQR